MNNAARAAVLEAHCRELKLPSVRRLYPDLVRQATHDGWDYEEFLLQLLEAEVLTRRDGAVARLLRQARFPDLKTFEQLDWEALGGWLAAMPFLDQLELAAVSALEPFIEFKSQETCSNGAGSQAFGPSGWPATCATPPRAATHRLYASATPPALCTVPRPRQPVPRPLVQLRHCRWSR